MRAKRLHRTVQAPGRRAFLRALAGFSAAAASTKGLVLNRRALAQTVALGLPLPDELVNATLKRLFGNRKILHGNDKIKMDAPLIAEDGGNVAITLDSSLPVDGATRLRHIYVIADKNRRPLLAKFTFAPESGKAFISTSIRLATSAEVRAVAEMSDGALYAVSKHVRVTISGCDVPPQS